MDRISSKKLLIGGVAVVALVVVIVFVAWPGKHPACVPTTELPNMKEWDSKPVGLSDPAVLAEVIGYIDLGDKTYLPFQLESVAVEKNEDDVKTVKFNGQCASFTLKYKLTSDDITKARQYSYQTLDLQVKNDKDKDTTMRQICKFEKPFGFQQDETDYYSCKDQQSHRCKPDGDKPLVNVVLKNLVFELDGKKENVENGKYTKNPMKNSCVEWQDGK